MSRGFIDVELSIPNRDSDKIGERLESFCAAWPNMFQGLRQRMPQVFSSRARDLFSHGGKILIERSESKDLATVGQRVYRSRERGEIGLQSSFLGNVLERLPVKICLMIAVRREDI